MKGKVLYASLIMMLLTTLSSMVIAQDVGARDADNGNPPVQTEVPPVTLEPEPVDSSSEIAEPELFTGTLDLLQRFDRPATVYTLEQLESLRRPLADVVTGALADLSAAKYALFEPDVRLLSLDFDGQTLTLDLSQGARGLGESDWGELLHQIDLQVSEALAQGEATGSPILDYYILIEGQPLFDDQSEAKTSRSANGIQGKRVVLSPGHGRYDNGRGGWPLQRGYHWGIVEDYINLDLVSELNSRLAGSGADIRATRQLDKGAGNHRSGYSWWQMDASEYIRSLGAPERVWKPNGLNGINRDIAARPEYANWVQANALVSIHNNGGGGDVCNSHGTETWYDTSNGYQNQSRRLATLIQNKLIERLRAEWDANWCNRGVKGSNGGYGENRRFRGPAVIVELAFMDVKSDNDALKNGRFRSIATAAIRDAIVEYFGGSTAGVTVDDVWTTDGGWSNRKTSFNPGDSIRYIGAINNQTGGAVTAYFVWDVTGPGGRIAGWSGNLNTGAGVWRWGLPGKIPANARPGRYTYSLKVTYNGQTFSRSATFTVAGASSCPNQYRAEYYNNRSLSGSPIFTQCEGWPIDHDWGGGGPGNGVGNDNFSARWTGRASISAGSYTFIARTDDGIRVWLDNDLIIDKWFDQAPTEHHVTRSVSGGEHDIRVEYYENGGGAVAQFRWERASSSCPTITRWRGEYWNNQNLSGSRVLCRNDTGVNFDWGSGGPGGGVSSDHFSAHWTRTMSFSAGRYRFHLRGDDGIRLWVDGNLIIDKWRDQSPTEYTAERDLSAGNHSLKVEYYENDGGATVKLWWESAGNANLALGRPAWATSQESSNYAPRRGNDGSTGTRWSSRISSTLGDEWWLVDLGSRRFFDRVVIRWEAAYAVQHFVGWSDDGRRFYGYWFTISRPGAYGYSLGSRNARYAAVLMRRRAPRMNNYSFWEFEVYQNARLMEAQDQGGELDIIEMTPGGDLAAMQRLEAERYIFLPLVQSNR